MGLGFDLNAVKLEAAKASEAEKVAILGYMKRYRDAVYSDLNMDMLGETSDELTGDVIEAASRDPAISPQTFVAFCVWAFGDH